MKEECILKSQTSIVYWAIIIIFLFISVVFFTSILKSDRSFNSSSIISIGLFVLFSFLIIRAFKRIYFFDSYLEVKYLYKKFIIRYAELERMEIQHHSSRQGRTMQSDNDLIKLNASSGKKIFISQFQFDNYYRMRTLIREILRSEN